MELVTENTRRVREVTSLAAGTYYGKYMQVRPKDPVSLFVNVEAHGAFRCSLKFVRGKSILPGTGHTYRVFTLRYTFELCRGL
jgi:hypothetical protein